MVRAAVHATADAVVTISDYTTDNFASGRSTAKYRMLENPLDVTRFDPSSLSKRDARVRLALDPSRKLVGLVAQITPWKGQDTAIRAMSLLRERHPDAKLLIVGDTKFVSKATRYDNPSFEMWLHKLTEALGLEDCVEFWKEREDIVTVIRALDALVAPSWEEPFGRSVIEAMALETPVVATDIGGPAEYIAHEHDGLLVSPFDPREWAVALDRLLSDPQLSDAYARRARTKSVERFDRNRYVSRMLDVYGSVVAQ
jgi:glycosyltransferase involved in cell wall biosynthesis